MNPFISSLKSLLVLEYPQGVRLRDLHSRHFPQLQLSDILIATLELAGDDLVTRQTRDVAPKEALFESEIARLRLCLAKESCLKKKRALNQQLILVKENLRTLAAW